VEGADGHGKKSKGQEVKDKLGGSGEVGQGWVYYDNQVCSHFYIYVLTMINFCSGGTVAEASMAGANTRGEGSGIGTPNWSKT